LGNHAQVAADMIKKWFGSKVNPWVDMDDGMTNNFEIFVKGKSETFLVHSRMKKNHKLFKEESPEHLNIVKKAIQDIISGREPTLPEGRQKRKLSIDDGEGDVKPSQEEVLKKREEAERRRSEMRAKLQEEKTARSSMVSLEVIESSKEPTQESDEKAKKLKPVVQQQVKAKAKAKVKAKGAKMLRRSKTKDIKANPTDREQSNEPEKKDREPSDVKDDAHKEKVEQVSPSPSPSLSHKEKVEESGLPELAKASARIEDGTEPVSREVPTPDLQANVGSDAEPASAEKAELRNEVKLEASVEAAKSEVAEKRELRNEVKLEASVKAVKSEVDPFLTEELRESTREESALKQAPKVAQPSFFGFFCCHSSKREDAFMEAPTIRQVVEDDEALFGA